MLVGGTEPDGTVPSVPDDKDDLIYGDLNGDELIDLTDLTLLSLYLLGDTELDADKVTAADVTGDDKVNIADLSHFKQYISKDSVKLGK